MSEGDLRGQVMDCNRRNAEVSSSLKGTLGMRPNRRLKQSQG